MSNGPEVTRDFLPLLLPYIYLPGKEEKNIMSPVVTK
jgi:hypothetical protein